MEAVFLWTIVGLALGIGLFRLLIRLIPGVGAIGGVLEVANKVIAIVGIIFIIGLMAANLGIPAVNTFLMGSSITKALVSLAIGFLGGTILTGLIRG